MSGGIYAFQNCIVLTSVLFGKKEHEILLFKSIHNISVSTSKHLEIIANFSTYKCINFNQKVEDVCAILTSAWLQFKSSYDTSLDTPRKQNDKIQMSILDFLLVEDEHRTDMLIQKGALKKKLKPTEEEWSIMRKAFTLINLDENEPLIREGETIVRLYHIISGVLKIVKINNSQPLILTTLFPEDNLFGIERLLSDIDRKSSVSVLALLRSQVLVTEDYYLLSLYHHNTQLASRIFRYISSIVANRIYKSTLHLTNYSRLNYFFL